MDIRKPLALGMLLTSAACGGFFATDGWPGDCRLLGCPPGEVCMGGAGETPSCERSPATSPLPCRVGDGSCNAGYICTGIEDKGFNMPGRCLKEDVGRPCNSDEECAFGHVCEPHGGPGECLYGKRLEGGGVAATLRSFQLRQHDKVITPWEVDGRRDSRLRPDFADERPTTPTTVQLVTQGPGADEAVALHIGQVPLCPSESPQCTEGLCTWTCLLPETWASMGTSHVLEFQLAFGGPNRQSHTWSYMLNPVVFEISPGGTVLLGDSVRLCATLHPEGSPLHGLQLLGMPTSSLTGRTPSGTLEVSVEGTLAEDERPLKMCQEVFLPLSVLESGPAHMTVRAEIGTAGYSETLHQNLPLVLKRTACSHNVGLANNAVTQPLAVSGRRLLFGGASNLYAFNTACTSTGTVPSLATGAVQGPMVVLGDTNQVAVATSGVGGPSLRNTPRLALLKVAETNPTFAFFYTQDCARYTANNTTTATYEQGLALLSFPGVSPGIPWRLVAPANNTADNQTRLVAYVPFASAGELSTAVTTRCQSSAAVPRSFLAPMVQKADGTVWGAYSASAANSVCLQTWGFDATATTPYWTTPGAIEERSIDAPSFMAIADNNMWIGSFSTSPSAVDHSGRAYAISFTGGNSRLVVLGEPPSSSNAAFSSRTVGSPLLGEPMENGTREVYVVSTDGRVLAFEAQSLGLLWTEPLLNANNRPLSVAPNAQPVLVANAHGSGTLWVVGTRGEVRGVRVASKGLSRLAQWPKALRDNCNTSSRQVTPDNMPGCFE